MNFTLYLLEIEIENCKDRLLYLLTLYKLTYPDVVECSQELDNLIVRYHNTAINSKKLTYKKAS